VWPGRTASRPTVLALPVVEGRWICVGGHRLTQLDVQVSPVATHVTYAVNA
jgi:hypothetical protein